jgi:hypothetical protein
LGVLLDIIGRIAITGRNERQESERCNLEQRGASIAGRRIFPPIGVQTRLDAQKGISPTDHRVNLLRTLGAEALDFADYASWVTNCFPSSRGASARHASHWG